MDESNSDPAKWTLPAHAARPPSRDGDLCLACDGFLNIILRPKEDSETRYSLGWLDRLRMTSYCNFCQFLVQLFDKANKDIRPQTEAYRVLCTLPIVSTKISESGLRLDWDLSVDWVSYDELEVDESSRYLSTNNLVPSQFSLDIDSFQGLGRWAKDLVDGQAIYHLGRVIASEVSAEFLRTTFELCETYHNEECRKPAYVLKGGLEDIAIDLSFLRVIDVQKRCLVNLPANAEYVALSYTWSAEPFISLTTTTLKDLQAENGIRLEDIPPTIADAMKVVEMLGQRYLWADRFCIVQDSLDDKRVQIGQMDSVYRMAALTIVASGSGADGKDPGLAGVRPGSRTANQVSTTVRGISFVETMSALDDVINASRWNSRAWTFQEFILSKRHLVFTPYRCAYFCSRDAFAEDHIRRTCFHRSSTEQKLPFCCEYEVPASFDDVHVHGVSSRSGIIAYEVMVREYTQRNLTVKSDMLDGVGGLLRIVTRETGMQFLCGMPILNLLDHFLHWLPRGVSVRRQPSRSGLLFPSWSWAGWVGPAVYPLTGDFFDGRSRDVSFEETLLAGDYEILIPAATDHTKHERFQPREMRADQFWSMESCLLSFVAPCASVQLSTTLWGSFSECDSADIGKLSRCNQVFINGSFAGMIQQHLTLDEFEALQSAEDEGETVTHPACLIALSSTYIPWAVEFPRSQSCDDDDVKYNSDGNVEPRDQLPFDIHVWDDDGPELINVLLVEWSDGKAVRKGVGQVHADAWRMTEVEEREVVLE